MTEPQFSNQSLRRWLLLALVLHLGASFFSAGFYHADEHFQILEFLNWKLGLSPARDLPIEFSERMRPWLQPGLFYLITRGWQALGQGDPFVWALSFRILSALIGWGTTVSLALCSKEWFSSARWQKAAIVALTLLWYLPAFHARPSSENWGGAFFIIGMCLYLLTRGRAWAYSLAAGICMGLAFEFRYQVAAMIAGFLLWLWCTQKRPFAESAGLLVGIGLAIALGTWVDCWGYGKPTFAPWNYIDYNLIRDMVSSVDRDPWYDLFRRAFTEAWPILGFLVLLAMPIAWISQPRSPLTWSHAALFLIHAVIGHKELRFLFPLIHAGPIFLVIAAERGFSLVRGAAAWLLRMATRFLYVWNLVALVILTLMPACMPIRFMDFLWHFKATHLAPGAAMTIRYREKQPYVVNGIALNFYRPDALVFLPVKSDHEIAVGGPTWYFYDGFALTGDAAELSPLCRQEFGTLPAWIPSAAHALGVEHWLRHVTDWSLYWCEPHGGK